MQALKKLYDGLFEVIRWIIIVCTGVMCIVVFVNVVTRYIFGGGLMFCDELSRFLFIIISMLGSVVCAKTNEHMHLSLVVDMLPKRVGLIIDIVSKCIIIFLCSILIYGGYVHAIDNWSVLTAVMRIPFGLIYMIIPVCALLMAIQYAILLVRELGNVFKKGEVLSAAEIAGHVKSEADEILDKMEEGENK